MTGRMSRTLCKRRLALVWFGGAGVLFVLVFLQTVFGRYAGAVTDAWGWFLPTVAPTLSLMVGVFVAEARVEENGGGAGEGKEVDSFYYRLALGLSLAYFLTVLASIALQPFTSLGPLELLKTSNLWLGPMQGLVTGALGVFFLKPGGKEK